MHPHLELFWQGQQAGSTRANHLSGSISIEEGERIQLAVLERWRTHGHELGGWKVGLTSGQSRDSFGAGIRPFGNVLKQRIFTSGAHIPAANVPNLGLETEVCFRIGSRLEGKRATAQQARAAVAAVLPAFELNQKRTDAGADSGVRVADNLSQWGIVIGPEIAIANAPELGSIVVTQQLDGILQETVHAAGHIDDHFESLASLTRELAKFDLALEAGMHVITGAFTRSSNAGPGTYVGRFSGLGEVAVCFTS